MARRDTISEEAWRVAFRKGGRVIGTYGMVGEAAGRKFLEAARHTAQDFDNAELQVRRAGASRYAPVLQLVGDQLIEWGA